MSHRTAFERYLHAQETTARRRAEREAANARLELAQVRERLVEIESQVEPLASNVETSAERARHLATAHYVVRGRWPREEDQ